MRQESGRGTLEEETPTNSPGPEHPVDTTVILSLLAAASDCLSRTPGLSREQHLALEDIANARRRLQGTSAAPTMSPSTAEPATLRCSSSRE